MTYPVQLGKIQAPALRDETLARTRLLDWLDVKIHSRVLFVIADAGYGKTTLLADFSRRTRLRTIWYRLDEDDRDWVGFLAHLVAAGREFDPAFAPRTAGILRSLEPGGPTREDAIETFLAELPSIAGDGAALIFDDFHFADEAADIRHIAREIISRGPERLSVIFASRRAPSVPVAKLRSLGELAEIGINDLRFSDAEMEQLFRETYGRPLEPDVLTELANRTEGWAASLTLIQAALRERTPAETRSFVRSLSGAHDELHDYLAEEVVGDLPASQQQFLMRTSILQRVTPELAQVATGLTAGEVQSMVAEAERLGMLGRRTNRRSAEQRYHPLVREFLEDRLRRDVGPAGVDDLHVTVATWAEPSDWQTAAHHFATAQKWTELRRTLELHLETVVASGAFVAAGNLLRNLPDPATSPAAQVILSRTASVAGDFRLVDHHAQIAMKLAPMNDVVLGNLMASKVFSGSFDDARSIARQIAESALSPLIRQTARAHLSVAAAALDGDLTETIALCEALADRSARDGLHHYEGVSWLNAALAHVASGRLDRAQIAAIRAVDALSISSSGTELAAALSVDASVDAFKGAITSARAKYRSILTTVRGVASTEIEAEYAETEVLVGNAHAAAQLLLSVDRRVPHPSTILLQLLDGLLAIRERDFAAAHARILAIDPRASSSILGFQSHVLAAKAVVSVHMGRPEAEAIANGAIAFAERQGARPWRAIASLARGSSAKALDSAILELSEDLQYVLSFVAELITAGLGSLSPGALDLVLAAARTAPERWLPCLRFEIEQRTSSSVMAARILDIIGEPADVLLLRRIARDTKRTGKDRSLGRQLARRLAPVAIVRDLGRIEIGVGDVVFGSRDIRRKVLAVLCFLLTRPKWSANREEVMDALWPDMDPAAAVNSLHQSVYFLRRVFEAEYSEDTTAGYIHQDSELLWLDNEMIVAASGTCAAMISEYEKTLNPDVCSRLAELYAGRFALDFAYEEWSSDFREWLHVAFLHAIETQVRADVDSGNYHRGIAIARRATEIDATNHELELSLLKLLRGAGAHSAAAEQYSHYANVLHADLGLSPPASDAV